MDQQDLIGLLVVYLYIGTVVIIATKSGLLRRSGLRRKFIHIMIGNIVLIWWLFDDKFVMAFLAAAPFIPILLWFSLHGERLQDENGPKSLRSILAEASLNGHRLGLVYYTISWTLLAFLLFDDRMIASIGIVAMAYGDGMGGLIGKRFGKHRIWGKKTAEGMTAVFIFTALASVAVFSFYQGLSSFGILHSDSITLTTSILIGLALGAYVSVVELLTPGEFDNLVIPLSVGLILLVAGV